VQLAGEIVVSADHAELGDRLQALIARASALVDLGGSFTDEANHGRARRVLSRAATRLQKFARAVGSRKGEQAIDPTLRQALIDEAVSLRADIRLLKQSL